ncbi:hypothetical protein EXN66_Car003932 [Channa argus]|uniref:Uncharacterized protein n=1 Tax=Channa argus TaxID=215402 RepID=A0A6G1PD77_CHAAH|nr:hypothetical protein EXN66_Car003932 [Channa argus]
MSLKLEIEGVMFNVVSVYAPQVGCELEEKEKFWSELEEVMQSIPRGKTADLLFTISGRSDLTSRNIQPNSLYRRWSHLVLITAMLC